MLLRLRNAATSMSEMVQRQDRVANNLANANTVGFKRDRAFTEVLTEAIDTDGSPQSTRTAGQFADLTGGSLMETGNPLDLALTGSGFFGVQMPDGETRYTRAGEFMMDADGTVRSASGQTLLDANGEPLTLPPSGGEIEINASGEVRIGGVRAGQIQVVEFADPQNMERLDGTTWDARGQEPQEATPQVRQGSLEMANVDAVGEMADLITHVRLFESQQKSLRSTDETLGQVTRDLATF